MKLRFLIFKNGVNTTSKKEYYFVQCCTYKGASLGEIQKMFVEKMTKYDVRSK